MNFQNARDTEQIRRMKALKKAGVCYFCRKGSQEKVTTPKVIYEKKFFYITPNNFPYGGSIHHYLIVPKRHLDDLTQISNKEMVELKKMIVWLKKHFKIKGYSVFIRSGEMNYTGATIDHLHFHFIVGKKKNKNSKWLMVTLGYKN